MRRWAALPGLPASGIKAAASGKTALAAEFGRRTALRYEDAAIVDLTRAESAEDLTALLAEALRVQGDGRSPVDALAARICRRRVP